MFCKELKMISDCVFFLGGGGEVVRNADRHMLRQGQHFALIFETIKYTETDKSCQDVFMLNPRAVRHSPVTRPFTLELIIF